MTISLKDLDLKKLPKSNVCFMGQPVDVAIEMMRTPEGRKKLVEQWERKVEMIA